MTDGSRIWFYDVPTINCEMLRRAQIMAATASAAHLSPEDAAFLTDTSDSLAGLSDELARAFDFAFWTFDFRGELDDALDGAFLRSVLASTPTFSGGLLASAA